MSNAEITVERLAQAAGIRRAQAEGWCGVIASACDEFNISTAKQRALFIAQISHESSGFERLVESMNYSAAGLRATWPSRFSDAVAKQLGRSDVRIADQVAIANIAYGDRLGNRAGSNDAWIYRGRGLIQLTGVLNYRDASEQFKIDLLSYPDLACQPRLAARIAAWFWRERGCNELAETGDVELITRRINGGTNGLTARKKLSAAALAAFGVN